MTYKSIKILTRLLILGLIIDLFFIGRWFGNKYIWYRNEEPVSISSIELQSTNDKLVVQLFYYNEKTTTYYLDQRYFDDFDTNTQNLILVLLSTNGTFGSYEVILLKEKNKARKTYNRLFTKQKTPYRLVAR